MFFYWTQWGLLFSRHAWDCTISSLYPIWLRKLLQVIVAACLKKGNRWTTFLTNNKRKHWSFLIPCQGVGKKQCLIWGFFLLALFMAKKCSLKRTFIYGFFFWQAFPVLTFLCKAQTKLELHQERDQKRRKPADHLLAQGTTQGQWLEICFIYLTRVFYCVIGICYFIILLCGNIVKWVWHYKVKLQDLSARNCIKRPHALGMSYVFWYVTQ